MTGLSGFCYFHGARGAFLLQLGRTEEARIAFDRAIALANTPAEAAHIRIQLDRLQADARGECPDRDVRKPLSQRLTTVAIYSDTREMNRPVWRDV